MALQGTRVESFPFDSQADGYDVDGYPVYDRAVGAFALRETFKQFFSDGIFPSEPNALLITRGSGLSVYINPGVFIIKGAMGYVGNGGDPTVIKLDEVSAAQGNTAYAIMLRYDENADARTLSIRVAKGEASSAPAPPNPDTSTPGVYEYRLGYVTVPNGATNLDDASILNERGTNTCPFAAPFEKIDLSSVTHDAVVSANAALDRFFELLDQNKGLLDSALDETTAGYLQTQITAIQGQLANIDLSGSVDDVTLEYSKISGQQDPKFRIKESGVDTEQLKNFAVEAAKLSVDLQVKLGVFDDTGWGFDEYYAAMQSMDVETRSTFFNDIDTGVLASWELGQVQQMLALLNSADQDKLMKNCDIGSPSWTEFYQFASTISTANRSSLVGRDKNATFNGSPVPARIISAGQDANTLFTFMFTRGVGSTKWANDNFTGWGQSTIKTYTDNAPSLLNSDLAVLLKSVTKNCPTTGEPEKFTMKMFPPVLQGEIWYSSSGWYTPRYQYFASGGSLTTVTTQSWGRDATLGAGQYKGATAITSNGTTNATNNGLSGHTENNNKTKPVLYCFCI